MNQIKIFKNSLLKKLKGYQKAPRERFLYLTNKLLTTEEMILLEFFAAITDWDEEHETYGMFKATNQQVAGVFGWSTDSTVCRHKNNLVKKGLLIKLPSGYFKVKDIDNWLTKRRRNESINIEDVKLQDENAEIKEKPAKMQDVFPRIASFPLVSSKGNVDLSQVSKYKYVTNEQLSKFNEIINRKENILVEITKL